MAVFWRLEDVFCFEGEGFRSIVKIAGARDSEFIEGIHNPIGAWEIEGVHSLSEASSETPYHIRLV